MKWIIILAVIGSLLGPFLGASDTEDKEFDDWLYNEADDDEW